MEHKVTLGKLPDVAIEMWIDGKHADRWWESEQPGSRWNVRLLSRDRIGAREGFVGPTRVEAIKIGTKNIARNVLYLPRKIASSVMRRSGIRALFARST
jgi:hypothetical protein